jgi:hypothetical protein
MTAFKSGTSAARVLVQDSNSDYQGLAGLGLRYRDSMSSVR